MYCISSCSKIVGSLLGHSLSNWNYNTFGKVLEEKIGSLRPKIHQYSDENASDDARKADERTVRER